jgi:hypothetical protein
LDESKALSMNCTIYFYAQQGELSWTSPDVRSKVCIYIFKDLFEVLYQM